MDERTANGNEPPEADNLPAPDEPDDFRLRRWEEFYRYAQASYARAHDRWTAADEKASKFLSILGLLIGAGAFTSGQAAEIFANARAFGDWLFIVAYVAGAAFAITAFACFLTAVQLQTLPSPPTRSEMVDFFERSRYIDVLHSLGRETLAAANQMLATVDRKFKVAGTGFELMRLAGICLLVASAAYIEVEVRNAGRSEAFPETSVIVVTGQEPDRSGSDCSGAEVRSPDGELRGFTAPGGKSLRHRIALPTGEAR